MSMIRLPRWLLLLLLGFLCLPIHVQAAGDGSEARMRRDITYLASDELEGRGIDTKGINLAADYIANEFKKAGLKSVGENGSYFQPFTATGRASLQGTNALMLRGPQGQEMQLQMGEHFTTIGYSGAGKVTAAVVFVGFGATAKDIGYDDYKDVNVADKIVVILRGTPRGDNRYMPFDGGRGPLLHAPLSSKLVNAELHKAAAVVFVSNHEMARDSDTLMDFESMAWSGSPTRFPAMQIRRSVLDNLLKTSVGSSLREVEEDIDRDLKPRSTRLTGWTATVTTGVVRPTLQVKNVVGVLEGSGPLANETIVIGAHYDHLGYGGQGSGSLDERSKDIHHGADDNGSGTTVVVELARRFAELPQRQGRRLVFMTFSGEERGLLGSEFYCKNPLFPLKDTVVMVNLDMVGRLRQDADTNKDKLLVYGTGSDKHFGDLMDRLNQKFNFQMKKIAGVRDSMSSSDHESFSKRQVPVLFFFTDVHKDYHRPSDTADKINVPGMVKIANLSEDLVTQLAQVSERPTYVKVTAPVTNPHAGGGSVGRSGPRLGILPDYSDEKDGLLLSGVSDNGPAAKAGLKSGDRILTLGGAAVKNIESYMVLMAKLQRGESVEIGIQRDGKKIAIKVVPE